LFYNPYFSEFYTILKKESKIIPLHRKKFLINYLLKYLADSSTKEIITDQSIVIDGQCREIYTNQDMYLKSNELLKILKNPRNKN